MENKRYSLSFDLEDGRHVVFENLKIYSVGYEDKGDTSELKIGFEILPNMNDTEEERLEPNNIKLLEIIDEETCKVWHEFDKAEVSNEEIKDVMRGIISEMRNNKDDESKQIKSCDLFISKFHDDIYLETDELAEIWDNIPEELLEDYRDNYDSTKEFIQIYLEDIINGFRIDSVPGFYDIELLENAKLIK